MLTNVSIEVADPYRWLEDDNSAETRVWLEVQTFGRFFSFIYREMELIPKKISK